MNWRDTNIRNLGITLAIIALGVFLRLGQVHLYNVDAYLSQAQRQYQPLSVLPAARGDIVDAYGHVLVTSQRSSSLYAFPNMLRNQEEMISRLSDILDMSPAYITALFERSSYFVWLERNLTAEQMRQILSLNSNALGLASTYKRVNTDGADQRLLGTVNVDNRGITGVELYYDEYLAGVDGYVELPRDAIGRPIWTQLPRVTDPVEGNTVYLTLDARIQFIVDREIRRAVQDTGALRGIGIAMNPKDGSVLAAVDVLGNRVQGDSMFWPFSGVYEPGSVFKPFTAYMALEKGLVTPETVFETDWKIRVGGYQISNYGNGRNHVWKKTFKEALAQSDNVVFVLVGQSLEAEGIRELISRFGFGQKTGIDYPGEATGLLPKQLGPTEIATVSFGQGIAVTPLQLVRAYSSLVNGGYLVKPRLVSKIVSPTGEIIYENPPVLGERVLNPEIASVVKDLLINVVDVGTGKTASVAGVTVGGKTGTGQSRRLADTAVPILRPSWDLLPLRILELVLLVMLDDPRDAQVHTGGWVAAPVFSAIVTDIMRYWGSMRQS